ncbi:Fur family ferric uptake transcriptional regulator [Hydrogenispora ethanolica]|uniref:Fur family ferric uptake transcriptional regulator n=1 Tax=Hydrogenispora ethanolica TaxID=1082276 RepID=A0A4R1RQM3_HYDET|nr:Fur family transcriptional regulator [Hydrogenispora ethanolica]TCL68539.1 Fur family ferric uptake transcriptional regulator [Hydrogenispora ethanolica]
MDRQWEKLKESGYRLTKKRSEILEAFEEGSALSADDIYQKVNRHCKVNRGTVYRNLNCLLKMNLVRKVNSLDQADRYELVSHHCQHVLECVQCGATVMFSECIFDQMEEEIASKTGYEIKQHHIEMYGMCPACRHKT